MSFWQWHGERTKCASVEILTLHSVVTVYTDFQFPISAIFFPVSIPVYLFKNFLTLFCGLCVSLFSLCLFLSLSLSLTPPVFLDTVLRQSCGLMVTWQCRVYCIVRQLPALPSAVLTVLSWMNEHTVLTRGATVSNNKTLFCSVKFYELLDLVSLLGAQKTLKCVKVVQKMFMNVLLLNNEHNRSIFMQ